MSSNLYFFSHSSSDINQSMIFNTYFESIKDKAQSYRIILHLKLKQSHYIMLNNSMVVTKQVKLDNGEILDYDEIGQEYMGKQPTILLVYGLCAAKEFWEESMRFLKAYEQFHVIAANLRGFAGTTYNQRCISVDDWALDLINLCSKIGIKKCVAVGWCFGSFISIKMAELAPDLVEKLVLMCNAPFEGHQYEYFDLRKKILVEQDRGFNELLFTMTTKYFSPESEYTLEKFQKCITALLKQDLQCLQDSIVAMKDPGLNWDKVKAKGLIIHGEADPYIKVETLRARYDHLKETKNFSLKIKNGRGHVILFEDAKTLAEDIADFVEKP